MEALLKKLNPVLLVRHDHEVVISSEFHEVSQEQEFLSQLQTLKKQAS